MEALVLTLAACGNSSLTRPASAKTRAAVLALMQSYMAHRHLPKGTKVRVSSVRVAASDPHFARAIVGLTGRPYKSGHGDTAAVVAIEVGGRWSLLDGPGSSFHHDCTHPTAKVVLDLICPTPSSG